MCIIYHRLPESNIVSKNSNSTYISLAPTKHVDSSGKSSSIHARGDVPERRLWQRDKLGKTSLRVIDPAFHDAIDSAFSYLPAGDNGTNVKHAPQTGEAPIKHRSDNGRPAT